MNEAFDDLWNGLKRMDLWAFLGWHDVKQRYRRSSLGPLWITIATLIFVALMTVVYSALFNQSVAEFLPTVAAGMVVWTLIAGSLTEGTNVFISASATIKQVPAPLPVHVFRLVWQQLIYFAHNLIVVALANIVAVVPLSFATLLFVPATALLLVNLAWMALLLGVLGARFRDVPLIVQSLISALFLVTPILWQTSFLPDNKRWVVYINPFTYLVDVVRAPLLGIVPSAATWLACMAMALLGWGAAVAVYARGRTRLAYWV